MEKISVLVVEDEWIVSEEIKEILIQQGYDVVGQADDSNGALEILEKYTPDILLLDINIKGNLDGIELANLVLTKQQPIIIFLTAYHDQYFLNRAKQAKPAAYIVKPFDEKNLIAAIEIAVSNTALPNNNSEELSYKVNNFIFYKTQTKFSKIEISNISFVKAEGSYIEVVSPEAKVTLALNLKNFESKLADRRFMRVHRSYLINLEQVDSFSGNTIYIGEEAIPISTELREDVLKRFKFI
jgi:DNA-binding LytR/AlgR family response regulator